MKLVTFDAETFYDREYSLSRIPTEAYVRSPQFEMIGFAIKVDDGPTRWVPQPEVDAFIKAFDWSDAMVLCQNTAFDGAILNWLYGVRPAAWADTLGMSRALFPHEKAHSLKAQAERAEIGVKGEEVLNAIGKRYKDFSPSELAAYAAYCCNDVELTYKLFQRYMSMDFPKGELRLIDLTLRMFIEPVLELDKPMLELHLQEVLERKETLLSTVRDTMLADAQPEFVSVIFGEGVEGIKKLLMSNEKFAQALRDLDVIPPTKISPTTGKIAYAFAKTDEAFKALEEYPDERVQALVAARLGNKTTLEETRTQRFIGMAGRGKFPVPLRYYGAHSGRWSGQDSVNLQNLPSRGANAGKIKKAIKAPPGYVVIDCDSAQIEARTLAWLAGQDDLVQAFRDKQDVYKLMASKIYGIPIESVDKTQRQVGKTVVLGAGYGVGHKKLQAFLKTQAGVEVALEEAKRIIDTYRSTSFKIADLWAKAGRALEAVLSGQVMPIDVHGLITAVPGPTPMLTLPSGLNIQYPGLKVVTNEEGKRELMYYSKGLPVRIYGGKCLAADTQVLTERGWIPLASVGLDDRVWDGDQWVNHSGLTYQGEKHTIVVDGVRMTPDHKVLTEKGWQSASSCEGLRRAEVRLPDGCAVRGVARAALDVGVPVSVRGHDDTRSYRRGEVREAWGAPLMRMQGWGEEPDACNVETPRVLGVAVDERPMPTADASSVAQLRCAWNRSVQKLASLIRGVLGRHGADVRAGVDAGPQGQRGTIQPGELPVGSHGSAGSQPQKLIARGLEKITCGDGYLALDPRLSVAPEAVYDLLNAGPQSRFMVRGYAEPFIVHNCVENICQAVARQIVAEQMLRIAKRYRVVLTVHDAVACIARQEEAKEAQAYVEECMRWNPKWATGLPLSCESGVGATYGDC